MNHPTPFKIQTPKQVISSAYPHDTDYVPNTPYVPQLKNVKAGQAPIYFNTVSYMPDPYNRQQCIKTYEQLAHNVLITTPFKCPKAHTLKPQQHNNIDNNQYAKVVILKNLKHLETKTKGKELERVKQLKDKAHKLFNQTKQTKKQNKHGFDTKIFQSVERYTKLLNIQNKEVEIDQVDDTVVDQVIVKVSQINSIDKVQTIAPHKQLQQSPKPPQQSPKPLQQSPKPLQSTPKPLQQSPKQSIQQSYKSNKASGGSIQSQNKQDNTRAIRTQSDHTKQNPNDKQQLTTIKRQQSNRATPNNADKQNKFTKQDVKQTKPNTIFKESSKVTRTHSDHTSNTQVAHKEVIKKQISTKSINKNVTLDKSVISNQLKGQINPPKQQNTVEIPIQIIQSTNPIIENTSNKHIEHPEPTMQGLTPTNQQNLQSSITTEQNASNNNNFKESIQHQSVYQLEQQIEPNQPPQIGSIIQQSAQPNIFPSTEVIPVLNSNIITESIDNLKPQIHNNQNTVQDSLNPKVNEYSNQPLEIETNNKIEQHQNPTIDRPKQQITNLQEVESKVTVEVVPLKSSVNRFKQQRDVKQQQEQPTQHEQPKVNRFKTQVKQQPGEELKLETREQPSIIPIEENLSLLQESIFSQNDVQTAPNVQSSIMEDSMTLSMSQVHN